MPRRTSKTGPDADFVRFITMVDISDDPNKCWNWRGNKPDGRYGHFSIDGKIVKAHRWIYEKVVEPIPDGLLLRHHCDNPSCVNPMHLEPGTHRDNVMDKFERGRGVDRKGEKHPLAKLSADDVIRIRQRSKCGESNIKISKDYPVGRGQIDKIINGQNWSHV